MTHGPSPRSTVRRRPARRGLPFVVAGLLAGLGPARDASGQALESLTSGPVVDGAVAGLVRSSGDVVAIFTRATYSGPTELSRGVYAMLSADGGRTFSAPVAVADAPGVRESAAAVIETPLGGVLYCYFVSDATGEDRVHWANSADGIFWNVSPVPLDLGLAAGESVARLAAVVRASNAALLVYEKRPGPVLEAVVVTDFIAPGSPRAIGPGVDPSLLAASSGRFLLASAPGDGAAWLDLRESADGLAWGAPDIAATGPSTTSPRLLELTSGRFALVTGSRSVPGAGRILRANALAWPAFGSPAEVPLDPADVAFPLLLADDASAPGLSLFVSRLEGDGSAHVARAMVGSCDLLPTFPGLAAADDVEPCAASGVLLGWPEPPSWGSAAGGEFHVHRSSRRSFVPDASTLLGVTSATTWLDDTVPPDVLFTYAVVAVGAETCERLADGTFVGLTAGANLLVSVVDRTDGGTPEPVHELKVGKVPGGISATWQPEPTAVGYLLDATGDPRAGTWQDLTGSPVVAPFTLPPVPRPVAFLRVRAVNACGSEGPADLP